MFRKISVLFLILLFSGISYAETIRIVGTGSGASVLRAVTKEFSKITPGLTVLVPKSIGSGGGIKTVGKEESEIIGRIARDLKTREKSYGLSVVTIAKIPVVIFVNRSVKLAKISSKQFCGIYSGKIRKWDDIKGGKGKIRVIKRENHDSSDTILRKYIDCYTHLTITRRSKTMYTDPATITECSKTKNAIAFGAWPNIKFNQNVKVLKLNGLHPENNSYKCVGKLSLIYKDKNYKGSLKKTVEFIKSRKAAAIIKKYGGIPVF